MWNKEHWDGYETVKESETFAIVYNPKIRPLDQKDKDHTFYLVYKPFGTIEAAANSIILINEFLEQAEAAWKQGSLDVASEQRSIN